jgi:hypothetical protein
MSAPEKPHLASHSRRAVLGLTGGVLAAAAGTSAWSLLEGRDSTHRTKSNPPSSHSIPANHNYADAATFDWAEKLYRNAHPRAQAGNGDDGGVLAWGEAYLLQAYLSMYRTTSDPACLDKFVMSAELVLQARDETRRKYDYLGHSRPIWSSGSPYTAAWADLTDMSGQPVFRVRSANGKSSTQLSATPSQHDRQGFALSVTNSRNGPAEHIAELSSDHTRSNYLVTYFQQRYPGPTQLTAVDLSSSESTQSQLPSQATSFRNYRYCFAVHTGMIASSLAEFAGLINSDISLMQRYRSIGKSCLAAARAAADAHQTEIRRYVDGSATYMLPHAAPVRYDGIALPHNQSLSMARLQLSLYNATRDARFLKTATSLLKSFLADLSASSAPVWPYFSRRSKTYTGYTDTAISSYTPRSHPNHAFEDLSHGALDIEVMVLAATARAVSAQLLSRLGNTFLSRIARTATSTVAQSLDRKSKPSDNPFAGARWAILGTAAPHVYSFCLDLLNRGQPLPKRADALKAISTLVEHRPR